MEDKKCELIKQVLIEQIESYSTMTELMGFLQTLNKTTIKNVIQSGLHKRQRRLQKIAQEKQGEMQELETLKEEI